MYYILYINWQSWWCNKERGATCNVTVRMRAQPKADFMRWNWISGSQYVRQQTPGISHYNLGFWISTPGEISCDKWISDIPV